MEEKTMALRTSLRYEMLAAWCGPLFVAIFVVCFGFMGQNLPRPISPASTAAEIGAHYASFNGELKMGWMLCLVFISLYMPWSAQISNQMTHIERHSRLLTYLQLIGGALTVFVVSFGMLCWGVATYRPERDAGIVQMLHDLGWLSLETQWALTTMQMFAMALAGLADKRAQPLFPRWVCWLTIWCGLSFVPASFTYYFKTGAFAWDGLLSYYIPYPAWLVWCVVASFYMMQDVRRRGMVAPSSFSLLRTNADRPA